MKWRRIGLYIRSIANAQSRKPLIVGSVILVCLANLLLLGPYLSASSRRSALEDTIPTLSPTAVFHSTPLNPDERNTTVRLRAELDGLKVVEIWPRVEKLLLDTLNLRLEDFEFRWVHIPSSIDASVLKEGEYHKYPMYHPPADSIDEAHLLVDKAYSELPIYGQPDHDYLAYYAEALYANCSTVILTAGNRDIGQTSATPRGTFNRKIFAATHGYCYWHMRCIDMENATDFRRRDLYPANLTAYAREIWDSVPKTSDHVATPHLPIPRRTNCPAVIDAYYYKFIALLKMWKEAPPETRHVIYLDEDVFVTQPDRSVDEWLSEIVKHVPDMRILDHQPRLTPENEPIDIYDPNNIPARAEVPSLIDVRRLLGDAHPITSAADYLLLSAGEAREDIAVSRATQSGTKIAQSPSEGLEVSASPPDTDLRSSKAAVPPPLNASLEPIGREIHPDSKSLSIEDSLLLVGSDFVAFLDSPVDGINVHLPINTGFIYWRRSESLLPMLLFAETLTMFVRDRSLALESMEKYWDTDQGVFTFVLEREFGLSWMQIKDALSTADEHLRLLANSQPLVNLALRSNTGGLSVGILPQRLTAAVPREPYLSSRGRTDLVWHPDDWMLHLYPGWAAYKIDGWKAACEGSTSALHKACWNTFREGPQTEEPSS